MCKNRKRIADVKEAVLRKYYDKVYSRAKMTAFARDCTIWYKNKEGMADWYGGTIEFFLSMCRPKIGNFHYEE
jgi:hypothetical protein